MYEELVMILRAKAGWRDPDDEYLLTQAADAIEEMSKQLAEWDKYTPSLVAHGILPKINGHNIM